MDRKYIEGVRAALEQMAEAKTAEGNAFTKALMAAREKGDTSFKVGSKEYKVEDFKHLKMAKAVAEAEVKYPHAMYDPKTGKEVTAKTPEDHEKFAKMGYTHDKPKEDASNDKSDDGEGMDKVDPKAAAKKFKDRKDKDIDNDGDVDSSDEYLHKRRKAISKDMKKESTVRERLTSIWEDAAGAKRMKDQNRENMPKDDARSDKKMMDASPAKKHGKGEKEDPESKKAEDSTKPAAMRSNDNKQGDKNIKPSATPDHPAHKTTKEQFDAIAKAWEEVQEIQEVKKLKARQIKKMKKVKGGMSMADADGPKAKKAYGMDMTYARANELKQTDYANYIQNKSGVDQEVYFDGEDLVMGDKTIVRKALYGKMTPDQLADKVKKMGAKK